ncbi:hypothetical protein OCK74_16420 [Chitinophagaceae bacterium LB-8]|uniref:Uncharacterized protein n=1 Tax=Paraflavisolibacter caeni TaxID=2982496 RepID=A0A9X3BGC9_9BACT|nr:hypothetical protein [Paraflavisolibacter caeni]MCU7550704.1 hypothetical protein [Paraflavisolibacter caeni]
MIKKIPIRETMNRYSAMLSHKNSIFSFFVLIEMNEKVEERVSSKAIREVNSSMIVFAVLLVKCNDVRTIKQNPSKFAAVPKMCGEVLLPFPYLLVLGSFLAYSTFWKLSERSCRLIN